MEGRSRQTDVKYLTFFSAGRGVDSEGLHHDTLQSIGGHDWPYE